MAYPQACWSLVKRRLIVSVIASTLQLLPAIAAAQLPARSTTSEESLAQAKSLLDRNSPDEAEQLLRPYLLNHPQSAEAHFLLGYTLFREIQTGAVDPTLKTDPSQMRERNARASLAEYTEGAKYKTPGAFDLKIVALDYVLLEDYPDAEKWLLRALAWQPKDAQGWYYLGRTRYKQAKYPTAIEAFQRALALSPQDVTAEDNLGLAFAGLGEVDASLTAFHTAITSAEAQHTANDGPWVDLGDVLNEHGRAREAVPFLEHAVQMAPQDRRAHETLAGAYRSLQQWPQEQAELEQAVRLAPQAASLHFMLGQVYRKTGQAEKARTEFAASAALRAREATAAEAEPHR